MKLRNKITGEVHEFGTVGATTFNESGDLVDFTAFSSIKDFSEEWEDYGGD